TVPTGHLLRRVHRRRTVRGTAYALASVAAVAALTLGGRSAILDAHRPMAPAIGPSPTASTSPTSGAPSASPSASASTPPVAWSIPWEECGKVTTVDYGAVSSSAVTVQLDEVSQLEVGAPFATVGHLQLSTPDPGTVHVQVLDLRMAREAAVSATTTNRAEWTTVGLGGVDPGPGTDVAARNTSTDGFPVTSRFVSCSGAAAHGGATSATTPLEARPYGLFVDVRTTTAAGETVTTAGPFPLTIVDPASSTILAPPTTAAAVTGDPVQGAAKMIDYLQPACGQTYPTPFAAPGGVVTMTGDVTVAANGAAVTLTATDTNTGSEIADGWATDPYLVLLRNGTVVAHTPDGPTVPFVLARWGAGSRVTRSVTLAATTCGALDAAHPVGSALPTGTYQLVAVQVIARSTSGTSGFNASYGGPWAVTLP
ncbi:MAG TPA: hypothetical protein VMV41_04435, partial [Cellulomonadaceae bacterium]|nr:hypothetical protein [Cellulomonadaceae bacterium]